MSLIKELRKNGYDQIESPIRNHKPLQLWLKKSSNRIELYSEHISNALSSEITLNTIEDNALSVNYDQKQEYEFSIGIKILEGVLSSLKLGNLGLSAKLGHGKKVTLSYNNSRTLSVPIFEISNFLSTAEFKYPNRDFIRNANRDNIILITGVLTAKDIIATIENEGDVSVGLEAELTEVADGEVDFTRVSENKLQMKSEGNSQFPVAVKANRIDWDKGEFNTLVLVTDNRFFF